MKLKEILKLKKEELTKEQLEFLKSNIDELTEEQIIKYGLDVIEEVTVDYKTKSNPMLGKKIIRAFSAKVKDLGEGMMEAVISSEAIDRHGERLEMKGMDLKEYMENPIIADGHDYSKPSVGRTHKLTKKRDGKLIAVFEWAKDISERANLLYKLYKNKFQFAFSIGFMVDDMDGETFTKTRLLEFSPVLIPANPEALLLSKKKSLDKGVFINYNLLQMYKLKEILTKELKDLTLGEVEYLKSKASELSNEDKEKFASVLEVKQEEQEEEKEEKTDVEAIKNAISEAVEPLKKELEEIKNSDPVKVKNINGQFNVNKNKKMTKELKFLYYARGLQSGNFKEYLNIVGKDAMNTTDESVLLPPEEFTTEVERLEEEYGVARRFANVRRSTNGTGIKYLQGDDDLDIYFTDEGGAKKSTSLSYAEKLLAWRKAAGILPITDELTEDSAVNLWNDATQRFARAFSRTEDELVFTQETGTAPINAGVLNATGVNEVTLTGDSFEDITYDDFVDMIIGVPTKSAANGRFYLHREILGVAMKLKDSDGRPLWLESMRTGSPATILGKPYELVEVLPGLTDDSPSTPFLVFGDLKYVTLGERTGLDIIIRDTGTVGDPEEVDQVTNTLNLFTQDMKAMRAVKRMNAIVRFPSAFSVMTTASGS